MNEVATCWLPLPPSGNNAYVNIQHGRSKSRSLKDWEEEAGWTWRVQGRMPAKPLGKHQAWGWSGVFWFPTIAGRDLDNSYKHIADLIVRVVFGGAPDDRYMVWDEHWKKVSATAPGVLVRVYEVPNGELVGEGGVSPRA